MLNVESKQQHLKRNGKWKRMLSRCKIVICKCPCHFIFFKMNGPEGLAIVNSDCEYLLITILSRDSEDRYISRLLCD